MPLKLSFDFLVNNLPERLQQNLPGSLAHEVMRAIPIGPDIPKFEHQSPPKPGSVLILLYPENDRILFPLTQRNVYKGVHSGQISLPGGKAEEGEDTIATAIREGEEEIGIIGSEVTVLGRLSEFHVIPSNFVVMPILAYAQSKPKFNRDPGEVEKIISGSVDDLMREDAIKTKEILAAGRYALRAPHFEMEGHLVWGATAMILNELRVILREFK
jgi:8-oxo-dGTP pyrophosphatase MutT (NUDIX family)